MQKVIVMLAAIVVSAGAVSAQTIDWKRTYGGDLGDYGVRITQTPDGGYAFLGRTFSFAEGNDDYWLVRLTAAGDTLWTTTYGGSEGVSPQDIITTYDGGFMVCGSNSNSAPGETFFAMKTNSVGDPLWIKSIGYQGRPDAVVQTQDSGFVFAGFDKTNGLRGSICKLSGVGDSVWAIELGSSSEMIMLHDAILVGEDSVIVVGSYEDASVVPATHTHYTALEWGGVLQWERAWGDGQSGGAINCGAMLTDGNLILGGYYYPVVGQPSSATLLVLNLEGDSLWSTSVGYNTGQIGIDIVSTIDSGFVFCVESGSSTPTPIYEAWIIKYKRNFEEDWRFVIDAAYDEVHAYSLEPTSDGGLIFGGYCDTDTLPLNMFAMKIDDAGTPTGVQNDHPLNLPTSASLSQNYPNPFNPSTVIEYSLAHRSHVNLIVLNMLGQPVCTLVNALESAGLHRVAWDGTASDRRRVASGMYFYRITVGGIAHTKKMILVK